MEALNEKAFEQNSIVNHKIIVCLNCHHVNTMKEIADINSHRQKSLNKCIECQSGALVPFDETTIEFLRRK